MKKLLMTLIIGFSIAALAQDNESTPANVQNLGFNFETGQSQLEVDLDKDFTFEKTVSEADRQVVIEIKNAKINKKWSRRIDTSQHKSNVSLISPYQSGDVVRVVLQLKENGPVEVTQEGNKLIAKIDNNAKLSDSLTDQSRKTAEPDAVANADADAPSLNIPDAPEENENAKGVVQIGNNDNANAQDAIDGFMQAQKTKQYVGKKIFLQLRDAELTDVFRVVSEASEFNIILGDEVHGKVTLNLVDVPWDQALDLILHSNKLGAERNGNVLRITTLDALTKEKEAEVIAQKASEAAEPLVVKIFPISYAKLDDVKKILEDFLSRELNRTQTGSILLGTSNVRRGSIQVDPRTNSLIVRDTPSTIEKIKKILAELDTQTPQILIEAKFVEVSETNTHTVEGRLFATSREFSSNTGTFSTSNNNFGTLFGGSTFTSLDTFAVTPTPGGASFGFAPRTGMIPGINELGALLSILESESQAKTIASPRVVTQNKEAAEISQGQTIMLPTPVGANATGSFQSVNVVLKLSVTPQVTNDGNILMKLSFNQDSLSAQNTTGISGSLSTDTKKIESSVLVDSGATLVIGGIYSDTLNTSADGIPVLRNLPLIGALFGSKGKVHKKDELFIFLTPRVLNEKEAGIKS